MKHEQLIGLGYAPTMQFEIQAVTDEIVDTGRQYVKTGEIVIEDREAIDLSQYDPKDIDTDNVSDPLLSFFMDWDETHTVRLVQVYEKPNNEGRNECVIIDEMTDGNDFTSPIAQAFLNCGISPEPNEATPATVRAFVQVEVPDIKPEIIGEWQINSNKEMHLIDQVNDIHYQAFGLAVSRVSSIIVERVDATGGKFEIDYAIVANMSANSFHNQLCEFLGISQ